MLKELSKKVAKLLVAVVFMMVVFVTLNNTSISALEDGEATDAQTTTVLEVQEEVKAEEETLETVTLTSDEPYYVEEEAETVKEEIVVLEETNTVEETVVEETKVEEVVVEESKTEDLSNLGKAPAENPEINSGFGSIVANKVDGDELFPLGQVHFTLTNVVTGEVMNGVTDVNGRVAFDFLDWGTYQLEETITLDGYILDQTVHTFVVDGSQLHHEVTIKNFKEVVEEPTFTLIIDKKDLDTNEALAGVEFLVRNVETGEEYTGFTNEFGQLVFEGLKAGKYEIVEVAALEGYTILTESVIVELNEETTDEENKLTQVIYNQKDEVEPETNPKPDPEKPTTPTTPEEPEVPETPTTPETPEEPEVIEVLEETNPKPLPPTGMGENLMGLALVLLGLLLVVVGRIAKNKKDTVVEFVENTKEKIANVKNNATANTTIFAVISKVNALRIKSLKIANDAWWGFFLPQVR